MQKVLFVFFILITPALIFGQGKETTKLSFETVFPAPSDLPGGASGWMATEIVKTKKNRMIIYEKNYSFYSEKKERILDIERNNTYNASVRIFACDNLDIAKEKYFSLVAVDEKIKSKKMSNPAPFGERGMLLVLPSGKTSVDFFITFILGTFIVQVYSDDGFAQIDVTTEVEKRLKMYMKAIGASFYLNKINLEISYDNKTYHEQVIFHGDDIAVVALDGFVFGKDFKGVAGAKIKARETGQETVTDKKGAYSMEISAAQGKMLQISKTIFIDEINSEKVLKSDLYRLTVTDAGKDIFIADANLFVTNDNIIGKYKDVSGETGNISGSVKGDNVTLILPCPKGFPNVCRRVFKGSWSDSFLKGTVNGGGLKGAWKADTSNFRVMREKNYLRDVGIKISQEVDNKQIKVDITPINFSDKFYLKKSELILKTDNFTTKKGGGIFICEIKTAEKGGTGCNSTPKKVFHLDAGKFYNFINLDITSELNFPNENGYIIYLEESGIKSNFETDIENSYADLYFFRDIFAAKPSPIVSAAFKTSAGDDIVGNANRIRGDGEADLVLTLNVSLAGRTLEAIDVIGSDGNQRRWNTNPFDIYPVAAIIQNGFVMNKENGSLEIFLESNNEIFDINLYKGSFAKENKGSVIIKVTIDGKVYETEPITIID